MESCSLMVSQILAEFRTERATCKTLHNLFSEMDYPNLLKNLTVGFLKLLSTHTISIL